MKILDSWTVTGTDGWPYEIQMVRIPAITLPSLGKLISAQPLISFVLVDGGEIELEEAGDYWLVIDTGVRLIVPREAREHLKK